MYLLDTNYCSQTIIGNPTALKRLAEHENSGISTCAIVQGELVDMAERSQRKTDNLALIQQFLQGIYVYPIDEKVAETYGKLKASLFHQFAPKEKSKRRNTTIYNLGFSDNDLWIAATALHHYLILVSSDSDFQRIQQIKPLALENWL